MQKTNPCKIGCKETNISRVDANKLMSGRVDSTAHINKKSSKEPIHAGKNQSVQILKPRI
jgi:hypothetical protein